VSRSVRLYTDEQMADVRSLVETILDEDGPVSGELRARLEVLRLDLNIAVREDRRRASGTRRVLGNRVADSAC
jgi:hypothetical protein